MNPDDQQAWFRSMWEGKEKNSEAEEQHEEQDKSIPAENGEAGDGDFGDDFDEFAEEGGDDDDFGDFDEAEDAPVERSIPAVSQPAVPDVLADLVSALIVRVRHGMRRELTSMFSHPLTFHYHKVRAMQH